MGNHTAAYVLTPPPIGKIGNSLGTGDIFRGWFLASFIQSHQSHSVTIEQIVHATKIGMAAATLKLQDAEIIPTPPTIEQLSLLELDAYVSLPYDFNAYPQHCIEE